MEPIENFVMDEGIDAYGVRKQVTFEGDQVVTKLTYDAAPCWSKPMPSARQPLANAGVKCAKWA